MSGPATRPSAEPESPEPAGTRSAAASPPREIAAESPSPDAGVEKEVRECASAPCYLAEFAHLDGPRSALHAPALGTKPPEAGPDDSAARDGGTVTSMADDPGQSAHPDGC